MYGACWNVVSLYIKFHEWSTAKFYAFSDTFCAQQSKIIRPKTDTNLNKPNLEKQ